MSNQSDPQSQPEQPLVYEIWIEGQLGSRWAAWFGDVTVTKGEQGTTLLTCTVTDQAALYGLLRKVRDLGLPLLSVNRVEPGRRA